MAPHLAALDAEQDRYREAAKQLAASTLLTWSPMVANLGDFLGQLSVIQAHVGSTLREQPILLAQAAHNPNVTATFARLPTYIARVACIQTTMRSITDRVALLVKDAERLKRKAVVEQQQVVQALLHEHHLLATPSPQVQTQMLANMLSGDGATSSSSSTRGASPRPGGRVVDFGPGT
eukprot:TRINITY_DN10912_c0_g1_i1.p2 TRINITY_DN10912_c0_g1~~TRINITY_DN10912_c0_g1_i1.p2  ORF type:complete len:178 (+),score=50.51 TRINITY_DN10912_c0_g1_i1:130-663(+)